MTEPSVIGDNDPAIGGQPYVLQLYVAGVSMHSTRAIINIKQICERYLPRMYSLEIIDVHQEVDLAAREQIVALPLLIKRLPLPERRFIGDLSATDKLLTGLGIVAN